VPPVRSLAGTYFVPKASTLPYLKAFLMSNSSSSTFGDIRASRNYIRGHCAP